VDRYLFRRDGSIEGRNEWSVAPRYGFKAPKRAWPGELSCQKCRKTRTPAFPSQRKRALEVIRSRLEGVARGEFIDSLHGIDELRNRWRSLKVGDTLSLHDILDCPPSLRFGEVAVLVLDERDDAHLCFALGALERVDLIDALYARGLTAPSELPSIVTLGFFSWGRGELRAFASSPTGVATVVSRDALVGLRYMARERYQKLQSFKLPPPRKATGDMHEPLCP